MGCNGSKSVEQASEPGAPQIEDLRRRLSLSEPGEDDDNPISRESVTEHDRSLMVHLTQQELFDFIRDHEGRRFILSSSPDSLGHQVRSFASKEVKLEGEQRFDGSKERLGFACKKGLKPEAPNQDSFLIMKIEDEHSLYGVFDGHGKKGHDVSNFVKENMPKILLSQEAFTSDPQKALADTFVKMQTAIIKANAMKTLDANRSGTTCSLVLHCMQKKMLYIAHVGDSRVVLGRKNEGKYEAVDLTIDHKPDLPEERARIEKGGGVVVFDGGWNYRVFAKNKTDSRGKRFPGLNMSRAMGDLSGFNEAGISATPDVNARPVESAEVAAKSSVSKENAIAVGENPAQGVKVECEEGSQAEPSALELPQPLQMGKAGGGTPNETSAAPDSIASDNSKMLAYAATPSVSSHDLDPNKDRFLLLCSDGVWEFISSEEAVKEVSNFETGDAAAAAEHLAAMAWDRWMAKTDGQVVDDITALVIHFQ